MKKINVNDAGLWAFRVVALIMAGIAIMFGKGEFVGVFFGAIFLSFIFC